MVYSPRLVFDKICSSHMFGSISGSYIYLLVTTIAISEVYGVLQTFLIVELCSVSTSESDGYSLYSRTCSLRSQGVRCPSGYS
jgi:hypothetical protein